MSSYTKLSSLFKLLEYIKRKRKIMDDKDKKELAGDFIDLCNDLLSVTGQTEDEKFMINSFLSLNEEIIQWSLRKCPENIRERYNNLKYNFINQNN